MKVVQESQILQDDDVDVVESIAVVDGEILVETDITPGYDNNRCYWWNNCR